MTAVDSDITLTPRLSVGTVEPESIYEAMLVARLQASAAGALRDASPGPTAEAEIELPLPPQNQYIFLGSKANWAQVPKKRKGDRRFREYPTVAIIDWHRKRGLLTA